LSSRWKEVCMMETLFLSFHDRKCLGATFLSQPSTYETTSEHQTALSRLAMYKRVATTLDQSLSLPTLARRDQSVLTTANRTLLIPETFSAIVLPTTYLMDRDIRCAMLDGPRIRHQCVASTDPLVHDRHPVLVAHLATRAKHLEATSLESITTIGIAPPSVRNHTGLTTTLSIKESRRTLSLLWLPKFRFPPAIRRTEAQVVPHEMALLPEGLLQVSGFTPRRNLPLDRARPQKITTVDFRIVMGRLPDNLTSPPSAPSSTMETKGNCQTSLSEILDLISNDH
jgi:hypothetical protein